VFATTRLFRFEQLRISWKRMGL